MEHLLGMVQDIYSLLEQINTITINQSTILLQEQVDIQEINKGLDIIDGMIAYKEELINQLNKLELDFEHTYQKNRERLIEEDGMGILKNEIEHIMKIKEDIVRVEKNNVMIVHNKSKLNIRQDECLMSAQAVIAAYKKKGIKS